MLKRAALWLVATAIVFTATNSVHADPITCQRAINKAQARFVRTKIEVLQRCRDQIVRGTLLGSCPTALGAVRIARARARLWEAVADACGGLDRQCGTSDDESLTAIGWDIGNCRNFPDSACVNAITDCNGVSACLACVGDVGVDRVISLSYDTLTLPASHPLIQRCQRALGKKAAEFFEGRMSALQRCEDNALKGLSAGLCPDVRAARRIARLEVKLERGLCNACGGFNRRCDDTDHANMLAIGFPDFCPDVVPPGGDSCARLIGTVGDAVECISCVTTFTSECLDSAAVPALLDLPGECTGPVLPPLCGNLLIESGEVCELAAIGCGELEVCSGCTDCTPAL